MWIVFLCFICLGRSSSDTNLTSTTGGYVGIVLSVPVFPPGIMAWQPPTSAPQIEGETVNLAPHFTFTPGQSRPCSPENPCQTLTIGDITLNDAWQGCLFSADSVSVHSGVVVVYFPVAPDSRLCLLHTSMDQEPSFNTIELRASSSCLWADMVMEQSGDFMLIFEGTTCASGSKMRAINSH